MEKLLEIKGSRGFIENKELEQGYLNFLLEKISSLNDRETYDFIFKQLRDNTIKFKMINFSKKELRRMKKIE